MELDLVVRPTKVEADRHGLAVPQDGPDGAVAVAFPDDPDAVAAGETTYHVEASLAAAN